jgi:hypothetical protein
MVRRRNFFVRDACRRYFSTDNNPLIIIEPATHWCPGEGPNLAQRHKVCPIAEGDNHAAQC